jgi:hypothetical protein
VSDRERTRLAATISILSVIIIIIGLALTAVSGFVGLWVMVLGAFGAVQAVLVGVGVMKFAPPESDDDETERRDGGS